MRRFSHVQRLRVDDLVGDPAALGAAVTAELCGHWEHDGPCRWPHHTRSTVEPDGSTLVTVDFDADEPDVATVRRRIAAGLAGGSLSGPDGSTSRWGEAVPLD